MAGAKTCAISSNRCKVTAVNASPSFPFADPKKVEDQNGLYYFFFFYIYQKRESRSLHTILYLLCQRLDHLKAKARELRTEFGGSIGIPVL